ncbi:BRCT domain-containing protein At4g02110 [Brachypodium distachyon]|uniref:BRCT domain-containing protein n=1 Tax=Brachypodium distachyon TaxID=15368 RepID=A0A0Q3RNF6_BRADI|nr:BRCT domain-containing protein At4g02110 [Brachypodium distachyon]KQK14522.1 hypothetical protein BRADI_1g16840v3 [Brachypodium distachyon]|eukprot:XP_003559756.1 BRCT domain-containing protein At4g02110 [Brachypodium distachyon]
MHGSDDDVDYGDDARLFAGVRFALVGFDSVSESQYRSEMARRGGADAGGHGAAGCTHVVVCGLVYDDPVCAAAREGGKKVVTELWVDDSLDMGALANADRVLYKPQRDLNGIPGSQSLNICLTGYQKNRREDIMKMVTLMGANFSKSLVAGTSTHLICYKFEGEKYELAKRVDIKLVNHRWLEDCLEAWEILPIDNYTKSGWQQEMMETQVEDSEDEAEDVGRGLSHSRVIPRSVPITKIRTATHVDPDRRTPIRGPTVSTGNAQVGAGGHMDTPKQVIEAEDISKMSIDIRADVQSTHNTNGVTSSADPEAHDSVHPPVNPSNNEKAPGGHIIGDEAKYGDKRAVDTTASTLSTLNTSGATVQADHLVHQPIVTPSTESPLKKTLHSSHTCEKVDQKDDEPVADLAAKVVQSNVQGNVTLCKVNLTSAGNSAPKNTPVLSYSSRRSRKSVSPGANLNSVHQTASPQSSKTSTLNDELNISPSVKSNHKISKHTDAKSLQDKACALAQRKSRFSSVGPITPNGSTDSATGTADSLFSSKEIASEAAAVSDLVKKSTGSQPVKVDSNINSNATVNLVERQKSGSPKKKLSYRRTSLKLTRSSEVEKLPESFANEKNLESLAKAKKQPRHEAAVEKGCAISPSVDSELGNTSSSLTLGNLGIEMGETPQVNNIEVVSPNLQHDKVVSCATTQSGAHKASTSGVKKAGAKRSRNAGNETHTVSVDGESEAAASKYKHDEVISHEDVEREAEKDCTSPNDAERTTLFPEKSSSSRARNAAANSSLNENSEMNDVIAASNMKNPQGNINKNHKQLSSGASAHEYKESSSKKVPNATETNDVANVSRSVKIKMTEAPSADKTKAGSLISSLSGVVPQAYTERLSSNGSANKHEICNPDKGPGKRMRNAVAKRKVSAAQQHRSGSEPCKTGGVFSSDAEVITSKTAADSSGNANKITVDQDVQNANKDAMTNADGSFCKDSSKVASKDLQKSKLRSSKRKFLAVVEDGSTNHNKENIQVNANITPKAKCGNSTKAVQNSKDVLDDPSIREGYDCTTLTMLEPTRFILSGHRLLRKEYRLILRRLKGRVCRDAHHWTFEATHFIAPELRRTEKFFAAAAAGRWILKSDYLSACNEAGKFVEEEPFEWHGDGLNNGETISLDSPRKWRQLRQRTGHGAFYGMQIIIYGECISPSLDTLKRAVRAGDGTILATAPPYTRFLKPGVSFAIVSAGVPRTDVWVQEFMNHKIPCINADYLVEYVCKPGHPLKKHILFDMDDLADESLQKLQKAQRDLGAGTEEVTEGGDNTEPSCSACGSNNREGSQLLICSGGEGNQASCGVAMHVDCWNPHHPEPVPDGEWLCPKCDEHMEPLKKAKKTSRSRVRKRS